MEPERNIFTFAVFVLFFPQLLAGPIERAVALLPQLKNKRSITADDIKIGAWLILWGYYLKVFMADNLAHVVNAVYSGAVPNNPLEILLGTYAFAFQILGDFAGYSSIAIGLARLMGFRLMTNFLFPYFVTNPQDFWHNWHISLSTWLRDYLYISLGGNRGGPVKTYRNLFMTMLLGGIWHGAAWPYFIWGFYQGSTLIVHRLLARLKLFPNFTFSRRILLPINILIMFQITCIGWLIFRAKNAEQIFDMLSALISRPFLLSADAMSMMKKLIFFALPTLLIQLYNWKHDNQYSILEINASRKLALVIAMLYSIAIWGEFHAQQFIYFQF